MNINDVVGRIAESEVPRAGVALLLVMTANSAAWATGRLGAGRAHAALDFGITLRDGTRLLGSHKTWRGLIAATVLTGMVAYLLKVGFVLGMAFGALALVGDAVSSFIKRRLRTAPGAEIPGLDQLPEALLPLMMLANPLGLGVVSIISVTLLFTILDLAATGIRHRIHR